MKKIDMRFDSSIINNWIGKKFIKYKCDPFEFTNSVSQIVGIYIDDKIYTLTNVQETVDYFGITDDIAIFKICENDEVHVKSAFKDVEMISTPVAGEIDAIMIINEHQMVSQNDRLLYDVWLTRAIIFEVDGREILFEKDTVPFSEEISIQKGYNLIEKVSDNTDFIEGWDDEYTPECTREVIEIRE